MCGRPMPPKIFYPPDEKKFVSLHLKTTFNELNKNLVKENHYININPSVCYYSALLQKSAKFNKVKVSNKFANVCVLKRGRNLSTFTGNAEPLKRGFEEVCVSFVLCSL